MKLRQNIFYGTFFHPQPPQGNKRRGYPGKDRKQCKLVEGVEKTPSNRKKKPKIRREKLTKKRDKSHANEGGLNKKKRKNRQSKSEKLRTAVHRKTVKGGETTQDMYGR